MSNTPRLTGSEYGLLAGYTFDDYSPSGWWLSPKLARWTSILSPAYRSLVSQNRSTSIDQTSPALAGAYHLVVELPFDDGTHWRVGQNYGGASSHNGTACFSIDMSRTNGSTLGEPIRASSSGQIVWADSGPNKPKGYAVVVEHVPDRELSVYLHNLGDIIWNSVNALGGGFQFNGGNPLWKLAAPVPVTRGQQVAAVGQHPNGDHHHWSTRTKDTAFPIQFSQFEYYLGLGYWMPVAAGKLPSGKTVRRRFPW